MTHANLAWVETDPFADKLVDDKYKCQWVRVYDSFPF
jgi:hypothetical protein